MKNFILSLVLSFTIITTQGSHIFVTASPDMTTGTDTACQLYWEEVWDLLEIYDYVHVLNNNWIPSPHVITANYENTENNNESDE